MQCSIRLSVFEGVDGLIFIKYVFTHVPKIIAGWNARGVLILTSCFYDAGIMEYWNTGMMISF